MVFSLFTRVEIEDVDQIAARFSDFLCSEEYFAVVRRAHESEWSPDCLLDVIEIWVAVGDATLVCPTFELFLQGMMQIIHQWLAGNRTRLYDNPLWPIEPLGTTAEVEANPGMQSCIQVPELSASGGPGRRLEYDNEPMNHPVLRKENFVLEQATRASQQRRELLAAAAVITQHFAE
jgi:hypothetical protein